MALINKLTAIADAIRVQSGKTGKLTLDQMPSEIVDLQSLGFEVVGGTTAPTSPKANTIWVNTSTTITSWVFSAEEPETSSGGMVWISTGAFSAAPFNALKKNNITVYPIFAKQYVNSAWIDKTAKIYQNGAWADWWNGELFINGNQYEGFTGGWIRADYYKGNDDNTNSGTLTIGNTIYLKASGGTYCKSVRTTNKIDLTNWKTLKHITTQYNKGEAAILITSQEEGDVDNSVTMGSFVIGESSLDITEVTGEYYIGVYVRNYGEVTIEEIYLEN